MLLGQKVGSIQETARKEGCPVLQQPVNARNADPKIPLPTGVSHKEQTKRSEQGRGQNC